MQHWQLCGVSALCVVQRREDLCTKTASSPSGGGAFCLFGTAVIFIAALTLMRTGRLAFSLVCPPLFLCHANCPSPGCTHAPSLWSSPLCPSPSPVFVP